MQQSLQGHQREKYEQRGHAHGEERRQAIHHTRFGVVPAHDHRQGGRGHGVERHDKNADIGHESREFCHEDVARAHRQARQHQVIAKAGEERRPLHGGHQAGQGHRQRDDEQVIGNARHPVRHVRVQLLQHAVFVIVRLNHGDRERHHNGEESDGNHLPLARGRDQVAIEEAAEKMTAQLEPGAVAFLHPVVDSGGKLFWQAVS